MFISCSAFHEKRLKGPPPATFKFTAVITADVYVFIPGDTGGGGLDKHKMWEKFISAFHSSCRNLPLSDSRRAVSLCHSFFLSLPFHLDYSAGSELAPLPGFPAPLFYKLALVLVLLEDWTALIDQFTSSRY